MDFYAVGLMSGTSVDAIDAAVVKITQGESPYPGIQLVHFITEPLDDLRHDIFRAFSPDISFMDVARLDQKLGERFAAAANHGIEASHVPHEDVLVIGSHGQTIAHYPQKPWAFSWQIGNPSVIAARTRLPVVSHFRSMDVAMGGQGAPLVPYFDWAIFRSAHEHRIVLNIGGIANLTWLSPTGLLDSVIGFDTGPGNMVLDGAVELLSEGKQTFDLDGQWAQRGHCDPTLIDKWMTHPYFKEAPPKSTGREQFGRQYVKERLQEARHLSAEDALRTLTSFVAATIAAGIHQVTTDPIRLIASGGGVHNLTLMEELSSRLHLLGHWQSSQAFGVPEDAKEAMAFAYLAFQRIQGRATNVPSVSGASAFHLQGSITAP